MRTPYRLRADAGVTLPEVVVSVALALVGMATALSFNRAQFFALRDQARQIDIQTSTRGIVDFFAREVRRAGRDPVCTGAFTPLVLGTITQVRFQSDLNSNGTLESSSEDLTYRMTGSYTKFERVAGSTLEVLLTDVDLTGSRFRYFDGAGVELLPSPALTAAQRAAVRRVRLELVTRGGSAGSTRSTPLEARAATDVELRNRFFIAANTCP
jgi:type II secretory pathway component PulJ